MMERPRPLRILVLSEDKSSVPVLEALLPKLLEASGSSSAFRIFPHRGRGQLPKDLKRPPRPGASSLFEVLPAKLRAYRSLLDEAVLLLLVVCDADQDAPEDLAKALGRCFHEEGAGIFYVLAICVEETEAWLLGDWEAIKEAYPEADAACYAAYVQDSPSGTWEQLAKVIYGPEAGKALADLGYRVVGEHKHRWAASIGPKMRPSRNRSPSFQRFVQRFARYLARAREAADAES